MQSSRVLIAGGGLAGLAAAAALGGAGYQVDLFEARSFLGGRATSYPAGDEMIDNCQHVLLRCFRNLLDFYSRMGVRDRVRFFREYYFIEPGGRVSVLRRGKLPAPLHLMGSFFAMECLEPADKLSIALALAALRRERSSRNDLFQISMLDWLTEKRQTPRAIERFWKQVLVSAVNEEMDQMAAAHGFTVLRLGFLSRAESSEMGLAAVPLGELYRESSFDRLGNVRVHLRSPVERIDSEGFVVAGERRTGDYSICALPFERLESVGLPAPALHHSPITGVHLWFDREITTLPYATLLDRTMQWMFNKGRGRYLQLVVSASRKLTPLSRAEVIELALRDLREYFPIVAGATLVKSHVVKEQRATFSAAPGADFLRPGVQTDAPNVLLAGDWTQTGWPATMEGAVRSGYAAAEAVTARAGSPQRFILPD